VGLEDAEDDFNFAERFTSLQSELVAQIQAETALNERILENLAKVKIDG
jgi:type I restriction enzyme M protein